MTYAGFFVHGFGIVQAEFQSFYSAIEDGEGTTLALDFSDV